jgi:nitroreductase
MAQGAKTHQHGGMSLLPLDPDELLSTTRAVRKRLDFDRPVPRTLIEECVQMAVQAPSGSNAQGWHFVVIEDQAKRTAIADIYRRAFDIYRGMPMAAGNIVTGQEARDAQQQRVMDSAEYLAAHMDKAPYMVIPCIGGRADGAPNMMSSSLLGSILPAAWSFMLAARARSLGTSWTTLHLMFEEEAAEVLGIPFAEISQVCLTPVAFTKGTDFKAAVREPLDSIMHWDAW